MKNKIKKTSIRIFVGISILFTIAFTTDNYFEISKNLDIFATLYREINLFYVDETEPGKLMKTGIDAMLKSLDPYTVFIPESKIEDYKFMTTGEYGGIGAIIQKRDEYVMVAEPYEGWPAQKAGLIAGDIIIKINGKSTKGLNTEQVREMLVGQPGTDVELTVKRQDKEIQVKLIREEIKIKDVPYYGMVNETTGYIKLNGFTETAAQEVKDAFTTLKAKGMEKLIFDLRGNGGGLLNEAVKIVGFFVDKGTTVVSTKGKIKEWDKVYKTPNTPLDKDMPLVVLIDKYSASASEIVSGSLQDLDRSVIVGENSFGKGLVQQVKDLSYNSKLKLTVAKYYTPSGRCIQKLDYSNKDEKGEAQEVPDSLIHEFETLKSHRKVIDGKGISPDVKVEKIKSTKLLESLVANFVIFDFATAYYFQHDSIPSPEKFNISDSEYNQFVDYVKNKKIDYKTATEKELEKLKKIAKEENFEEDVADELSKLEEELKKHKNDDIYEYKNDIKLFLENEIVGRYYYQTGQIRASLVKDPVLKKAKEIIADDAQYSAILSGLTENKK
ncbi:MAG TPA: peptidase S41 [Flavobacteriales bacterium]|nr:peptidase S41 [Flavobacteriales bacterium]